MKYSETYGHWPLMKPRVSAKERESSTDSTSEEEGVKYPEKAADGNGISTNVRTIGV